ncbi:MAG: hypothetical protein ACW98X_27590 [Promethearchaeota archaeon]|jgi:hypothetical protein
MNVFIDYVGSADLYYSMRVLFEERLNWNLYRPSGGSSWKAETNLITGTPIDDTPPKKLYGLTYLEVSGYGYSQKCISFEQFKGMHFDILVSTSWNNEKEIVSLGKIYHPKAAVIRQIANIGEQPIAAKNVILSTLTPMPQGISYVTVCPENLDQYEWTTPVTEKIIKSFSSNLPSYPKDVLRYHYFENMLPEFTFRMHGEGGEHNPVPQQEMPSSIKESMFVWHTKGHGGCGYIPRQALDCGKPLIVNKSYCRLYKTLCLNLLVDGINCIDIDPAVRPFKSSLDLIREWSQPDIYPERCKIIYDDFKKRVNFEQEANMVKQWILQILGD